MKKLLLSIVTIAAISLQIKAQSAAEVKKDTVARSLPSPLESPPFPSSEWDGAPLIGIDATAPIYPFQKALGTKKSKFRIYGWIDAGGNISSSKNSNAPTSYDIVPNTVVLDQAIIRMEVQPNTVQTDHVSLGFLVDNIFGTDYRYTIAKGIFSNQLLGKNNKYGYDPTQAYALAYFPKVADGMLLKVGRFISPADIEAQWAPDNYLYTHSLMFTVDPYTFSGAQATFKLGAHWQLEAGIHGGNDVAVWSNAASVNGLLMARWVSNNNNNSVYAGINSLGAGKYKDNHDDLQMVVATWGHRFNNTLHMMTEAYYIWQKDALVGGTVIEGPPQPFYTGVGAGSLIPGTASAIGAVNYFQIKLSGKDYVSIRNGYLNDRQGNRTGYVTSYSDHTIGFVHSFNTYFRIRPEIRYERAYADGVTPYDNGTKKDQYSAAMDLIVRF
ncbi:outer membrane beta-barrel protein [uncultured Mucilaginibacter sp.]|uniref:outer membrane beta-barrel protein n=1 Tax=uncultured Mucilaginibacter sp. TaxID=797541 RepID=UPI0026375247|nr:outer membrane beta-barrel protein [uncultured Mucilaginibacter sp.]